MPLDLSGLAEAMGIEPQDWEALERAKQRQMEYPALDLLGRTPRERGEALGATHCGCLLQTDWRALRPLVFECLGCGSKFGRGERLRRLAARHQSGKLIQIKHMYGEAYG